MTATRETYVVASGPELTLGAVSQAPILIPEHEVMFGTTVALSRQQTTHWWAGATAVIQAAIHRIHAISAPDARPVHHDCPKRYAFLESACLAREVDRL